MISFKNIANLFWFKVSRKNKNSQAFQDLVHNIHLESLAAKNIGQGAFITERGESNIFKYISFGPKPVIFDVGANQGDFSQLVLDSITGPIIYAFEPVAEVAKSFSSKISSNQVQLVQKGIGEIESKLEIFKDPNNNLLSSVYQRDLTQTTFNLTESETIEVTTIDAFCKTNNIPAIDYLKIDIEGHEIAALKGAEQMLSKGNIKHIQFEFGGCNLDSRTNLRDFFNLLSENYKIHRILEDGLLEINYDPSHEVYNTTNFLAVKR